MHITTYSFFLQLVVVVLCKIPITSALSSSSSPQTHTSTTTTAYQSHHDSQWKNKIIACASTKELTRAIELCVQPHHKVAELGSQLREVSTQICERCSACVLVDVQRKFPSNTKSKNDQRTAAMRLPSANDDDYYPDKSVFREIPKLQDWRQAFFGDGEVKQDYDVLVLDVNAIVGNDLEWTSLSLIKEFQNCQTKDLIILVKSLGLNQFASRLVYGKHFTKEYSAIPPPHILATVGVQEYRDTIPFVVNEEDTILEVGCHFGTSTALLQQVGEYCIGVDVGSKIIKQAKKKYPDIYFAVGDAWKTASLLRIQQDYYSLKQESGNRRIGFDVVYVDVGGLSGSDGLLEAILLVSNIQNALEPRSIVIKSLCMQRLSTALVSFWQLQKKMKQRQQ